MFFLQLEAAWVAHAKVVYALKTVDTVCRNSIQVCKDLTQREKVARQVVVDKDKRCNTRQNSVNREIEQHNKAYHLTYLSKNRLTSTSGGGSPSKQK